MQCVFVTGATGFIGSQLCLKLAQKGCQVHALVRDVKRAMSLKHPNIKLFVGDLFSGAILEQAMVHCEGVFHIAAYANVSAKDPDVFYNTNVKGTENVIQAAIKVGVKRLIFTSSAGVLGPSVNGVITEETISSLPFFSAYESSKYQAGVLVKELCLSAIEYVIVYPTRVYGPGLLSDSNGVTRMIQKYLHGKWHTIPGDGNAIGNYVYIDDVITGLILAFEQAENGHEFLLGGENVTYNSFFTYLRQLSGKSAFLVKIPSFVMLLLARMMVLIAQLLRKPPLITPALTKKFTYHWETSCDRAKRELGYRPKGIKEGMRLTIDWIQNR